jgi:ATP-dependent Lon protease
MKSLQSAQNFGTPLGSSQTGSNMATLIRAEDHVEVPDRLPVVALRDLVFFPYIVLPILIGRHRSIAALEAAQEHDGLVLLVAQKDPSVDDPTGHDLFQIGTVARVVQVTTLPDSTSRVVLEGLGRARIRRLTTTTESLRAKIELLVSHEAEVEVERSAPPPDSFLLPYTPSGLSDAIQEAEDAFDAGLEPGESVPIPVEPAPAESSDKPDSSPDSAADIARVVAKGQDLDAAYEKVRRLYADYARLHERIPEELSAMPSADGDRVRFAHLVAGHLIVPSLEKQEVLEATGLESQLEILGEMLLRELEMLRIERKLDRQIQLQLGEKNSPFDLGARSSGRDGTNDEPEEWEEIATQISLLTRERGQRRSSRV